MYDTMDTIMEIGESLVYYASPILIIGDSNGMEQVATAKLDARCPKEELLIVGGKLPRWLDEINNKDGKILFIDNFDKISLDDQRLFIDLISKQSISSEKLPNLKIIIHADKKFDIIPEIGEEIEIYEM